MPKNLLVADDSLTIRKIIGMVFATEDVQITAVDNGVDAIARARELRPDLVMADVTMPGKNGYEVCESLKADPQTSSIPVLLLAGTFEPFDEARARKVGANDHVVKPFESQAIVDKVKALVGGTQARTNFQPAAAPNPNLSPRPSAPLSGMPTAGGQRPTSPGMPAMSPGGFPGAPRPAQGFAGGVPQPMPGPAGVPRPPGAGIPQGTSPGIPRPAGMGTSPGIPRPPGVGMGIPQGTSPGIPRPPGVGMGIPQGTSPGIPRPPGVGMGVAQGTSPGIPRPPGMGIPQGTSPGIPRPPGVGVPPGQGFPRPPGAPGGFAPPPGAPRPGMQPAQARDPFGGQPAARPRPPEPQSEDISLDFDSSGSAPAAQRPVAARGADGGEALLRDALSKASREVIEKIAWEVVPQLAETIIREELERLIKEREGKS